ncbi:MAG TPA: adenosylhomocysteinase [Euryarchaeota archaeon]|nr:adenosylhomocysteinase [Euryarchaeota archaeon]
MASDEKELVQKGEARLKWARDRMKVLGEVREHLKKKGNLKGVRVGMALHTEAKTGVLAETIHEAGAEVCLTSCNPLSTDDCVAAALRQSSGIEVHAKRGQSQEEYYDSLNRVVDFEPDYVIDDGADLIFLLHTDRKDKLEGVKGANEETTTGIIRLRAMAQEGVLRFPVMSVNDAMMKHLFDNRYGTGQSTFDGIMSSTNLLIAGRRLVVAGYGWCGRGIAMRAKGLGARVTVTEVDPVRAIEASLDGFEVSPMAEAVEQADFIVTATGCKDILRKEHFERMKSGCVMANSGHFDNEISKTDLESISSSVRNARDNVIEYSLAGGKKIFLIAEGRLVNLAAGQGHPVEIMDMSFALQAMALGYLLDNHEKLSPDVHPIPTDIDEWVARTALKGMGLSIDSLSDDQRGYLCGWRDGT